MTWPSQMPGWPLLSRAAIAAEQAALATQSVNSSNAAAIASTEALAVAQANAASAATAAGVAMRGGSAIIGALGGPIGIAVTAIGLLAMAWISAGNEADAAARRSGASRAENGDGAGKGPGRPRRRPCWTRRQPRWIAHRELLMWPAKNGKKTRAISRMETAKRRLYSATKALGDARNNFWNLQADFDKPICRARI